jgi:26S proteasome regulatory subunit T4
MDEIDAIGGRRFSEGTSADREIQRTLMELLSQLDGFDIVGKVSRLAGRGMLCLFFWVRSLAP